MASIFSMGPELGSPSGPRGKPPVMDKESKNPQYFKIFYAFKVGHENQSVMGIPFVSM